MEDLAALRHEVGALAFGAVLAVLGAGVLGFALTRRRAANARLLLLFGPFALAYGARLLARTDLIRQAFPGDLAWDYVISACTYLLPVILISFFEELHGEGWHGSMRLCRLVWIAYAALALAVDAVRGPGAAMAPNSVLVVLLIAVLLGNLMRAGRLGGAGLRLVRMSGLFLGVIAGLSNLADLHAFPWKPPEEVGFAVFVAALCVLAAERYTAGERQLLAIGSELATARRIQASLLPRTQPALARAGDAPFELAARTRPATEVGGDLYDWFDLGTPEEPRMGVLVADVAGHGVPAALLAAMVKMANSMATASDRTPEEVLAALNAAFAGKFERSFVTAAFLDAAWSAGRGRLRYASGGHPAPLLLRAGEEAVRELVASGPVLGRFQSARFSGDACDLRPGDRVLLLTDGVLEAPGAGGASFGEDRVHAALRAHRALPPEGFAARLLEEVDDWQRGAPAGHAREDDVTIVVLDCRNPG